MGNWARVENINEAGLKRGRAVVADPDQIPEPLRPIITNPQLLKDELP